jgi:hypothetical protein
MRCNISNPRSPLRGQIGRGNLFQPGLLLWAAETEAKLGLLDNALDHIPRYDELIQQVGPLEGLAWFPSRGVAHRVRGIILAKQGAFEAASAQFSESLELLAALSRLHPRPGAHACRGG